MTEETKQRSTQEQKRADRLAAAKARREGKKTYYTGRPCRNGHHSERYVSTNACIQCVREAQQRHLTKKAIDAALERGQTEEEARETLERDALVSAMPAAIMRGMTITEVRKLADWISKMHIPAN